MSERLKRLLEEIQKTAQVPGRSKGEKAPAAPVAAQPVAPGVKPGTSSVPQRGHAPAQPTGTGTGGVASTAVQDMQKKLIELSKLVLSQMNLADIAKTVDPVDTSPGVHPIDKDHPEPVATQEATQAAGRGSFGDFIAKRLRNTNKSAVEFDPSPNKTNMKDKNPSIATRMGVIMDTMMRIGGPKAEFNPDGKWGPRTNAALNNAASFASAMLKLSKDFELPIRSYTESNLQDLEGRIPDTDTSISFEEKKAASPILVKHLDAIIKMFKEIKNGILEKPAYQAFIEGDKPYATYGKDSGKPSDKPVPAVPNGQAIASMQKTFSQGFPILVGADKTINITVNDLVSADALKKWMYDNQVGRQYTAKQIIEQVRNRANGIAIADKPKEYEYNDPNKPAPAQVAAAPQASVKGRV